MGLCHIVEDHEKFSRNFFYEVLGSALEQDIMMAKAPAEIEEDKMKQFKAWFRGKLFSLNKEPEENSN